MDQVSRELRTGIGDWRLHTRPTRQDAIIVCYHGDGGLTYVARMRNGFVPALRRQIFGKLRPLARVECPFVNLPETRQTGWGQALTAEKMKKCVWVNTEVVAQIEFLEWTEIGHLRHSKYVGLRWDEDARNVVKEHSGGV
jgi:ATP-dependent DNA ligase